MFSYSKKFIGIIGVGSWGKNLVRVFYQLGVLKAVADLNKDILRNIKKEYPGVETVSDFSEILEDQGIKGIIIATPAATHYKLAKKVLESEKDVFVEKPLALKTKEGEKLVDLAKKRKKILMVGHLLLYHPAIIKLKKIIKRGELGRINYIWSNRLNFGKLRKEENVLWSFAPHDISVIIDILGGVKKVSTIGKSYLDKNIPDVTLTVLEFAKNQTAHIFVSWLNPFKEQKLSIIGSKKMAVFDGVKNELVVYSHRIKKSKNKNPEAIKGKGKIIKISPKEPLKEEAKHFLDCINKRKTPKTDGKEALAVLRVLDDCQKSLEENSKLEKKLLF